MRRREILWMKSPSAFTSPTRRACAKKHLNRLAAGADFFPQPDPKKPGAQPHLSTGYFSAVHQLLRCLLDRCCWKLDQFAPQRCRDPLDLLSKTIRNVKLNHLSHSHPPIQLATASNRRLPPKPQADRKS